MINTNRSVYRINERTNGFLKLHPVNNNLAQLENIERLLRVEFHLKKKKKRKNILIFLD